MSVSPFLGTIVTLGGGGFSTSDSGASAIDDHILALSGRARPRVCFVPTASGDADGYAQHFEQAFADRARTSVLSLFCHQPWGYRDPALLLDQDVIYVGGGSTANLLAVWRLHGLPGILRRAAANGTVLAGVSAGMNCWFEASSTDSFGPLAPLSDGLGYLPGAACPHLTAEPGRWDSLRDWVGSGVLPSAWGIDEEAAIVWRDGHFVEAIGEQPDRRVVHLERSGSEVIETDCAVRLLGETPSGPARRRPALSKPD